MLEKIKNIVDSSLVEILKGKSTENHTNADLTMMTFYGENGVFDSISLVSLILVIEEKIQDTFNCEILLANEKAMSQINSPFRNYKALTQYIYSLLEEENRHENTNHTH